MTTKGFGRLFTPDAEDTKFPMRATLRDRGLNPPKKMWELRGTALDQGSTGTCVGHGWTNWLRCAPIQTKPKITPYELYRKIILVDEYPGNDAEATGPDSGLQSGTSVRSGAKYLADQGNIAQYVWAQNLMTAVDYVTEHGPVVMGTNWYPSMFTPDAEGYIRLKAGENVAGGHCWLIRGVDTRKARARMVNSWGEGWGKGGEAWIAFNDLERLIHEDGEACGAAEKRKLIKLVKPILASLKVAA